MPQSTLAKATHDEMQVGNKKPYAAPRIEHELEMETQAGSPIVFDIDPASGTMPNPWDPEYTRK